MPGRLGLSVRCCSGWGLQRTSVAGVRVSSYLAFPPLPAKYRRYISVALSRELPPQGITLHPALWSSDFPHAQDYSLCPRPSNPPENLKLFVIQRNLYNAVDCFYIRKDFIVNCAVGVNHCICVVATAFVDKVFDVYVILGKY